MLNIVFIIGMILFALTSAYFWYTGRSKQGLNSAFLVSLVTFVSYVLMWQGKLIVSTNAGQPIYWSRWLFYGLSCSLLMYEIAQLKGIKDAKRVEMLYLTVLVMFTGFLAARDLTAVRWIHFVVSSIAYVLLVLGVLGTTPSGTDWVHRYVFFGWTAFPVVFLLAPTGLGLLGAPIANLIYLLLDLYTKVIFNVQLSSKDAA